MNVNWKKIHSVILSVTCHSLRKFSPFIHIPSYPFMNFWNTMSYYFFEFESFVKGLNVNWEKIHSIIFWHFTFLEKLYPHSYTSPYIHSWIFETLWLIISWVWVICKRLNVNWKKNHLVILYVTCHSLRNFPPLIHIPSYPFVNVQHPKSYYFSSLSHS